MPNALPLNPAAVNQPRNFRRDMDINTPQIIRTIGQLFLSFPVTLDTIKGIRFLDTHLLVTSEALLMIGALHSGPQNFRFVERLAMATVAAGRLFGSWAIMVARLTNCALLAMKVLRQLVVLNFSYEPPNNPAVRKINRLVLIRQVLDGNRFRNILVPIGVGHGCS